MVWTRPLVKLLTFFVFLSFQHILVNSYQVPASAVPGVRLTVEHLPSPLKELANSGTKNLQQKLTPGQRNVLDRIQQTANGNVPKDRKEEASVLRTEALNRIKNLKGQLDSGKLTVGQALQLKERNQKQFRQGKALTSAVFEGIGNKKETEKKIEKIAEKVAMEAVEELEQKQGLLKAALDVAKKELKKHHHTSKGVKLSAKKAKLPLRALKKANRAQEGFMAIVMHKVVRPPVEQLNANSLGHPLKVAKDVHNLLWTAVVLAREKLASDKTKTPACLLEFLGRMVGGAFAPFVFKENHRHIAPFLHKMRHYEVAFLSAGYKHFWREKIGKVEFEEMEIKVKPVFINHEA